MYTGASTSSEREKGGTTIATITESTIGSIATNKNECSALAPKDGGRQGSISEAGVWFGFMAGIQYRVWSKRQLLFSGPSCLLGC